MLMAVAIRPPDTSSSTDLWNIRAMPNVAIHRLNTRPISLKANPTLRYRPRYKESIFNTARSQSKVSKLFSFC